MRPAPSSAFRSAQCRLLQRISMRGAAWRRWPRVAELVAQARQGVADGRLAEMQEARRAGQVAFSIDHFEDPEQVQIETAEGRPFMWLIHVCARLSGEGASLAGMLADRTMHRRHGWR